MATRNGQKFWYRTFDHLAVEAIAADVEQRRKDSAARSDRARKAVAEMQDHTERKSEAIERPQPLATAGFRIRIKGALWHSGDARPTDQSETVS
jgi:hypothetical protein